MTFFQLILFIRNYIKVINFNFIKYVANLEILSSFLWSVVKDLKTSKNDMTFHTKINVLLAATQVFPMIQQNFILCVIVKVCYIQTCFSKNACDYLQRQFSTIPVTQIIFINIIDTFEIFISLFNQVY